MLIEYNMQFMNLRDEGGLIWPKINTVTLCRTIVIIFKAIINDTKIMADLQSSMTSSYIGLKII